MVVLSSSGLAGFASDCAWRCASSWRRVRSFCAASVV